MAKSRDGPHERRALQDVAAVGLEAERARELGADAAAEREPRWERGSDGGHSIGVARGDVGS